MNNLNQILIEGNLIKNPELKHTDKGTPNCTFTVSSKRYFKQVESEYQEEISFFDIVAWTELGETCARELKKGRGVRVIGRLKQDRWQDSDGKQRSKVFIVADHVIFKPEFVSKKG